MTATTTSRSSRTAKPRDSGGPAPKSSRDERPGRFSRLNPGTYLREHPLAQRLDSPLTTYYVLMGTTALLVLIGLVMVLSASNVTSYQDKGSSYAIFANQAGYAVVGLVGAVVASRIKPVWFKRLGLPILAVAVVLELLVLFTGLGVRINGNRNWLRVAGVSFQPSELIKIGLILAGATLLANKRRQLSSAMHVVFPFLLPIVVGSVGLVLLGHDLGTSLVILGAVVAVLFVAGVPGRYFGFAGLAAAAVAAASVISSGNRTGRIANWLSGSCNDPNGVCGQSVHGLYALADGGWWGVGLGLSKEKWGWLAEARNDFIFAIIGEELGLPGTLTILVLFALLGWACYRLVARSKDQFVRVATGGVMAWVLLQAVINIGSVIGLLPVIGVPLPLISAGGSALVTTLFALGMLLSFARHEPGAIEALSVRPKVLRRSLTVVPRRAVAGLRGRNRGRSPGGGSS